MQIKIIAQMKVLNQTHIFV